MLYAIISEDIPGSLALRQQARPAHLLRLQALQDEGRLVLAGPHPAVDACDPGAAGIVGTWGGCRVATGWLVWGGLGAGPRLGGTVPEHVVKHV